jgi:hypothetical protein
MTTKKQTLKELTDEISETFPKQPEEAIIEYINNIAIDSEKERLKEKLKKSEYLTKFKTAITHMPLLIYILASSIDLLKKDDNGNKKDNEEIFNDINRYTREFMFFSRDDDDDIIKMKNFYFTNIKADEIDFWENDENNEEQIEEKKSILNRILIDIHKKYKETKLI